MTESKIRRLEDKQLLSVIEQAGRVSLRIREEDRSFITPIREEERVAYRQHIAGVYEGFVQGMLVAMGAMSIDELTLAGANPSFDLNYINENEDEIGTLIHPSGKPWWRRIIERYQQIGGENV